MVIETNLNLIFWETVGGIIKSMPYFILIIWGVRKLVKEVPNWISQMNKETKEKNAIKNALDHFGR